MTLMLELPDDLAQTLLALPEPERSRRVTDALRQDILTEYDEEEEKLLHPDEPIPGPDGKYKIMDFYGIGEGRPGAVGNDVETYLRDLRSDWDDQDVVTTVAQQYCG